MYKIYKEKRPRPIAHTSWSMTTTISEPSEVLNAVIAIKIICLIICIVALSLATIVQSRNADVPALPKGIVYGLSFGGGGVVVSIRDTVIKRKRWK